MRKQKNTGWPWPLICDISWLSNPVKKKKKDNEFEGLMLHFFVFQMGQCHGGGHYFIASAKLNKWCIHSVTATKLPAACELSPSVRIHHIRPFVGYWVTIQTPGRFFLKGILLYGEEQQNPRVGFHKSLQEQLRYLKYVTWEKKIYFFCFHLFFRCLHFFLFFFFAFLVYFTRVSTGLLNHSLSSAGDVLSYQFRCSYAWHSFEVTAKTWKITFASG